MVLLPLVLLLGLPSLLLLLPLPPLAALALGNAAAITSDAICWHTDTAGGRTFGTSTNTALLLLLVLLVFLLLPLPPPLTQILI